MQPKRIDMKRVSELLQQRCPFILFAFFAGMDEDGKMKYPENLDLSVYTGSDTQSWSAIEKILPVMTLVSPEVFCEVTILNLAGTGTRFYALTGHCLFIKKGQEYFYREFDRKTNLDYRILRAHERRRGIVCNDVILH